MNLKMPDLTPSRCQGLVCPKRFHADFVEKTHPIGWNPKLSYANGVHAALKRVLDPRSKDCVPEPDLDSVVRRSYREQYYPDEYARDEAVSVAASSLRAYLATVPKDEQVLDVEVFARHNVRVHDSLIVPMGARFDALVVRAGEDGTLVALDYKTCSPRGIPLWAACISYVVAHANLGRFCQEYGRELTRVMVEYRFVGPDGLSGRTVLTREDVKCVWSELKMAAAKVYGDPTFPAIRGEHCCGCHLYAECYGDPPTDVIVDAVFG